MSVKRKSSRRIKRGIWFKTFGTSPTAPCHWKCGKILTFNEATIDHEPALAEGGSRSQAVIDCRDCNHERGKQTKKRLEMKKGVN